MMYILNSFLIVLSLNFYSTVADTCKCLTGKTVRSSFRYSNYVIKARILESEKRISHVTNNNGNDYLWDKSGRFKVLILYQYQNKHKIDCDTITITTDSQSGLYDCGVWLEENKIYFIYFYRGLPCSVAILMY